jgi:hypothetical protein
MTFSRNGRKWAGALSFAALFAAGLSFAETAPAKTRDSNLDAKNGAPAKPLQNGVIKPYDDYCYLGDAEACHLRTWCCGGTTNVQVTSYCDTWALIEYQAGTADPGFEWVPPRQTITLTDRWWALPLAVSNLSSDSSCYVESTPGSRQRPVSGNVRSNVEIGGGYSEDIRSWLFVETRQEVT